MAHCFLLHAHWHQQRDGMLRLNEKCSRVFGMKKLHSYLFWRCFTLQTDSMPLHLLFSKHKPVSPQASGLHAVYQGMAKMKRLAHSFFWWPMLDTDIEAVAGACGKYQQTRGMPPSTLLHPWSWPSRPWSQIHLDYTGPVKNKMFLLLINAHTKWMEVFPMVSVLGV